MSKHTVYLYVFRISDLSFSLFLIIGISEFFVFVFYVSELYIT